MYWPKFHISVRAHDLNLVPPNFQTKMIKVAFQTKLQPMVIDCGLISDVKGMLPHTCIRYYLEMLEPGVVNLEQECNQTGSCAHVAVGV